ncbi:MAG TPA: hypothetical protein VG733_15205, partial [Chthoniobacteraceae bacterium]|nr:hypothetical protein [Chthoniobacteraceae bacterium]
ITAMYFWGEYRANSPRYVYEETFHEELPPDVVPLFGKDTGNWASDGIELRVKASPATFDRLLQRIQAESKPELSRFTLEEFKQSGASIYASRPAEMELPKEDSEIYVSNERFGAEYVEFTYNPDTQIIQFYWYDDY